MAWTSWFQQYRTQLIIAGVGVLLLLLSVGLFFPQLLPRDSRKLTDAERRAALEALQVLRGLQSITTAGVSYRDYAPRVLDAKVQLDRYLGVAEREKRRRAIDTCQEEGIRQLEHEGAMQWEEERKRQAVRDLIERCQALEDPQDGGSKGDKMVKFHVENAMEFYLFAARAWNAKISGKIPMGDISEHRLLDRDLAYCPSVTEARDRARAASRSGPDYAAYRAVRDRVPELWGCASRMINEVEAAIERYS